MDDCSVRAVEDYVITRREPPEHETDAGLHLPSPNGDHVYGEVVAVGPGVVDKHGARKPMDVVVGERVFYYKRAATSLPLEDDDDLERVRQRDLLAVLEEA